MEPRLIDVDQKVKLIDAEDPELDSLRAAVASLRTRHITLESQACRYKQKLEVNVHLAEENRFNCSEFFFNRTLQKRLHQNRKSRARKTKILSDTNHFFLILMIGSILLTAN